MEDNVPQKATYSDNRGVSSMDIHLNSSAKSHLLSINFLPDTLPYALYIISKK